MKGLYAIVDLPHPHGLSAGEVTAAVLAERLGGGSHGAAAIQLRAKQADTQQRVRWLQEMAPHCRRAGAPLWVNDDLQAALTGPEEIAGLHLGQGDPGADDLDAVRRGCADAGRPGLQLGLSTHDLEQLRAANRQRPDYVAFGPVAPTRSKERPDPVVGLDRLTEACRLAAPPLVAIGGLDAAIGAEAIARGAAAVAVISALHAPTSEAIAERACALSEALQRAAAPLSIEQVAELIPVLPREQLIELASWADDVGVLVELGLPARFAPCVRHGQAQYRRCDVLDLQHALGKRADESWSAWRDRAESGELSTPLVQLRRA